MSLWERTESSLTRRLLTSLSCINGPFALYRVKRSKRGRLIAVWKGMDQYGDLKGGFRLRKNGRHRFWFDNLVSESEGERMTIDVDSVNDLQMWSKMQRGSLVSGTVFFDPNRAALTVAESGCMWSSAWLVPMFLDQSVFSYFECEVPAEMS